MQPGKRPRPWWWLAATVAAAVTVTLPLVAGCSSTGNPTADAPAGSASTTGTGSSPDVSSSSAPDVGSPAWVPATPTATGPRAGAVLELTGTGVGPVRVGAEGHAVEAALTELLGVPDRTTDGAGCTLFRPVPRERAMFWGDFHVLLTAPTVVDPTVTLTGWSVGGRSTPVPVRLPHGIALGTSTGTDVRRADQAAGTSDSLGAGIILTDTAGVQFVLSGRTPASPVVQAVYGIDACE